MSIEKVRGARGVTYYYRFEYQGRTFKKMGFVTKELAEQAERQHRTELQTQGHEAIYGPSGPKLTTWAEALELYRQETKPFKTQTMQMARMTWWADWAKANGVGYIQAVTDELIELGIRHLDTNRVQGREGAGRSKQTQHHYLAQLRAFYKCIPIRKVCRVNPTETARWPKVKRYKAKLPDKEQRARLLLAADPHMRRFITAAMYTGLREDAILTWQVEHFTERQGWLKAYDNKMNEHYWIPVLPALDRVVKEIMQEQGIIAGPLWRHADGTRIWRFQRKAWLRALAGAGFMREVRRELPERTAGTPGPLPATTRAVPTLRFHDLRHLVGSTLAESKIPEAVIRAFMHHASKEASAIYTRLISDTALTDAAHVLASGLER